MGIGSPRRSNSTRQQLSAGSASQEGKSVREKLKARIMLGKADPTRTSEECGQAWVNCSPDSFKSALKGLQPRKTSARLDPGAVSDASLMEMAMALADSISRDERLSKLKALERCIDGAADAKELQYHLARFYPRLLKRTQEIVTEHFLPCSVCLKPREFKSLFHFFRVFFEARKQGFQLEDAQ